MTYQEIQDRLSKCEATLKNLKAGNYSNISQEKTKLQVEKLTTLRESLQKQLKEADGTVSTADPNQAEKLADKGVNVKLVDKDELETNEGGFDQNETAKIAAGVGKAVVQALNSMGENISKARVINIKPDNFDVRITFANDNEEIYQFFINEDDRLILKHPSYDRDLADVGENPSGAVVNIDVVKDAFGKELKSIMSETMTDQEFRDAKEKDRLEKHPEKDTIKKIQALIARERRLKNTKENDEKAGITISNPNPTGIRGNDKPRTGKGKIHPFITGDRSVKEGEYAADKYNVNVFGYQTKHYKICPGAKAFMEKVVAGEHGEVNKEEAIRLAKLHDLLFLYEIKALKDSEYAANILSQAEYLAGEIKRQVQDMGLPVDEVDYLEGHIEKISDAASETDYVKRRRNDDYSESTNEGEGDDHHYIKVPRVQYKKAQKVIDDVLRNDVYGGHKHDIVDNDGRGNVIFYFMGPEEKAITYDAVVYLRNSDVDIVDSSVEDIEEGDGMTTKIKLSDGDPTNMAYTKKVKEAELSKAEKGKVKKIVKQLKKSVKGHGAQAKYLDTLVKEGDLVYLDDGSIDFIKSFVAKMGYDKDPVNAKEFSRLKQILQSMIRSSEDDTLTLQEGRGDMDMITRIIDDRADESGFESREEAAEVIAAIADHYKLNLKMIQNYMDSDDPVNPFADPDAPKMQEEPTNPLHNIGFNIGAPKNDRQIKALIQKLKDRKARATGDELSKIDTAIEKLSSKLVNENQPIADDLDVGHQDDEPSMLKSTAYESAAYAAKLYKKLAKYDQFDGEVDFPNWWQSKLILAKDYLSKAFHYIDSKEKQPMLDKLALENKGVAENADQDEALDRLRDIVGRVEELGEEARDIVRQNFPNELSRMDGYGVFNMVYSSNRYDTTLGSEVDRLEDYGYDDLDDDDYPREGIEDKPLPKGKHSVSTLQKVLGMIIDKMKELNDLRKEKGLDHMYQGGSEPGKHSVKDHLISLTKKKKKVEAALEKAVANVGRGQQLDPNVDEKEIKHDCANHVMHEKYGHGICLEGEHTLLEDGTVTHYDVFFKEGSKTVKNIPVNELNIITSSHHGHKRRKK